MIVHFNEELRNKHVLELIEQLDKANKEKGPHTLYFSSPGGGCDSTQLLLHYLNNNCLKWKLIAHTDIFSNALDVYLMFKGKKEMLSETIIMIHTKSFEVHMRELLNNDGNLKRAMSNLKRSNKKYIKLLKKIGVSKKHIMAVKSGKDVYLYKEDIKKLKL